MKDNLLKVPETVDPQVANLTEPLACDLHAIEITGLKKNDNVLVLGVGPIGLLITYICSKEFASNTVACDTSAQNYHPCLFPAEPQPIPPVL